MPTGGWPSPNESAAKGLARLEGRRHDFSMERGFVFPIIMVRPPQVEHSFTWLLEPPDVIPHKARWYIDGSCTNPRWLQARGLGYALVLVGSDGTLLAAGNGNPPGWVTDSGGSETWAFLQVLTMFPVCCSIITDYHNIIVMLQAGGQSATAASRPLARIWRYIYNIIISESVHDYLLMRVSWMPSHCTLAAIGTRVKSDGEFVSAIDWRANRLADHLARLAANLVTVPKMASDMLDEFTKAAEYCAASLGVVTHAANNHIVPIMRDDGKVVNRKVRDNNADQARELGRAKRQHQDVLPDAKPLPKRTKGSDNGAPDDSMPDRVHQPSTQGASFFQLPMPKHTAAVAKAKAAAKAKAIEAECENSFRESWRNRLDARATTKPVVPGSARLAALKDRIKNRSEV
jgi:hypothetical protein